VHDCHVDEATLTITEHSRGLHIVLHTTARHTRNVSRRAPAACSRTNSRVMIRGVVDEGRGASVNMATAGIGQSS